jgi:hypothetical protein
MTTNKNFLSLAAFVALSGIAALQPNALSGQDAGGGFMFNEPNATLTFNFGYGIPNAGSDIFREVEEVFTLGKGDFRAPVFGGGLSFFLNDRMDLAFEVSYTGSSTWSEYVDWVDNNDLPIEQKTKFKRVPVTGSFRYFLKDRGRKIGNFSWIPTAWAPYIGAGGGGIYYQFAQIGDFVDFVDYSVFQSHTVSDGWSWVGHVFGGLQWTLSPQWVLTAEGRYSMADADLDRNAYKGYEPIDLSGFQGTLGFGVRF